MENVNKVFKEFDLPYCDIKEGENNHFFIFLSCSREVESRIKVFLENFFDSLNFKLFQVSIQQGELVYEGNLNLEGTPIKSLPEGLEVGGNLNLYGTPIKSLPEGLEVGGEVIR
jgi:hypothetical protein